MQSWRTQLKVEAYEAYGNEGFPEWVPLPWDISASAATCAGKSVEVCSSHGSFWYFKDFASNMVIWFFRCVSVFKDGRTATSLDSNTTSSTWMWCHRVLLQRPSEALIKQTPSLLNKSFSPVWLGVQWIHDTLWLCQNSYWKWPFIVDFPIKNGDFAWLC
jgi:hypothetical protein